MDQDPKRLSDCCSAPAYEEVGMEKCSKCRRLCFSAPETLEIAIHDTMRTKDGLA